MIDLQYLNFLKGLLLNSLISEVIREQHQPWALHTCWIYKLAELESITNKREAGTLKNLISSVSDLIRPPYLLLSKTKTGNSDLFSYRGG